MIERIQKLREQRDVAGLIAMLTSERRAERNAAADALATLGDLSAAAPIAAALLADKEFSHLPGGAGIHPLAHALVKLPAPGVAEQLAEGLPSADRAIRASIVFVLSHESDASLAALLIPYLDDAEPSVRAQVATWIGRSRDASRVDELLDALARETSDGHVSPGQVEALIAQIAALGELRDRRAVGPLRELLKRADDGRVTAAVEKALSKMT